MDHTKTEVYAQWLEQLTPEPGHEPCPKALKRVATRLREQSAQLEAVPHDSLCASVIGDSCDCYKAIGEGDE